MNELRKNFLEDGAMRTYEDRKKQLLALRAMVTENGDEFCNALNKDLHKVRTFRLRLVDVLAED